MKSDVLIIGATGTVGTEVTRATLDTGARVRALVRSESSAARLVVGAQPVMGDLRDEDLAKRISGSRSVFFVAPHEPDEETLAARVIDACERNGSRLVFVGVHVDGANRFSRSVMRMVYGRVMSHYQPKFRLSERVRQAGCDPVVLMPTNYFQNDELFRHELESGFFPQPFQKPVNRVDVRDLAIGAARALTDFSLKSGAYPVVGPQSFTGAQCAQLWTDYLGRKITADNDPARLRAAFTRALHGKKRDDFIRSYEVLTRYNLATKPDEVRRTEELLRRPPTSYAGYVRELAENWRASTSYAFAEAA